MLVCAVFAEDGHGTDVSQSSCASSIRGENSVPERVRGGTHVIADDTVLDAALRDALEPAPLAHGHLALLAGVRHRLDARAHVRHVLLLRLLVVVELRAPAHCALDQGRGTSSIAAREGVQLALDRRELLPEEELLLLLGKRLVDGLRDLACDLGDGSVLHAELGRALDAALGGDSLQVV